jgi:cytochrome P450
MTVEPKRVPPGPAAKYEKTQDLLEWMNEQFNRFGDIYRASVFGTEVYVINDPQYVDQVLRSNWQNYTKGLAIKRIRLLLGNGLMVSEGALWKAQRQMIQPAFHHEMMSALIDVISAANLVLLDKWRRAARKKESVNITRDVSDMILKVGLTSIFGDDYDQVAAHFQVLFDESARNLRFAEAFRPVRKVVLDVATRRRKRSSTSDILSVLALARDRTSGRPMADNQLVSEIITLVVAGHETTASTVNWVWYLLSRHPEVENKLVTELNRISGQGFSGLADMAKLGYTRHVLDETLRLYPPGWLMTRKALKDDQFGQYFVPSGTEVYISPYLIQRHPTIWDSPEQFDPDRFEAARSRGRHPMTMLPFSAGPRRCIGEALARIEMQMHLVMIAKHLRLRCSDTQRVQLESGVNLRNKYEFMMTPEIRQPSLI